MIRNTDSPCVARWSGVGSAARIAVCATALALTVAGAEAADPPAGAPPPGFLLSNAILVETAYHQEADELESTLAFSTDRRRRGLTFSQEWPLGSERHQLSIEVPAATQASTAWGDLQVAAVGLSYGYLLRRAETSRVIASPTVGLALAAGFEDDEPATGVEVALPVSAMLSDHFATTTRLGVEVGLGGAHGEEETPVVFEVGQSLVWMARPTLNVVLDVTWEREEEGHAAEVVVCPGVRWAHRLRGGVVVVPAVGAYHSSHRGMGVILSASIEHGLWFGGER
jgi:hypothetical protein